MRKSILGRHTDKPYAFNSLSAAVFIGHQQYLPRDRLSIEPRPSEARMVECVGAICDALTILVSRSRHFPLLSHHRHDQLLEISTRISSLALTCSHRRSRDEDHLVEDYSSPARRIAPVNAVAGERSLVSKGFSFVVVVCRVMNSH